MAKVETIEAYVVNGKTYTSFAVAMLEGTKDDLKKFIENDPEILFSEVENIYDFILRNTDKISKYISTIENMEEEIEKEKEENN